MVEITWLGHASFQLKLESGEAVFIDPWFEGNPKFPADFPIAPADIVLLTHGHGDHIGSVATLLKDRSPKVVSNFEIGEWLSSKGTTNVIGMNHGGTVDLGSLAVTMTSAVHTSSIEDGDTKLYGGQPAGFILHFPDGRRMYYAGDTAVMADMRVLAELYTPELVILPIGGFYTMDAKQAAYACRMMRPKRVIPMHYGTFPALAGRPEELRLELADLPGIDVWTLQPGQPVQW